MIEIQYTTISSLTTDKNAGIVLPLYNMLTPSSTLYLKSKWKSKVETEFSSRAYRLVLFCTVGSSGRSSPCPSSVLVPLCSVLSLSLLHPYRDTRESKLSPGILEVHLDFICLFICFGFGFATREFYKEHE